MHGSIKLYRLFFIYLCIFIFPVTGKIQGQERKDQMKGKEIRLPSPSLKGNLSVEEALSRRRSIRDFGKQALNLKEISQMLWACGGRAYDSVTSASRTYPSAGGLYPLEIYLVAGNVESIDKGVYIYNWKEHTIQLFIQGDIRRELAQAALSQMFISTAPASIVITAVYGKTKRFYGERGEVRYVHMDAGHAAQNVYLEAEAMGLGTVAVGAFSDTKVKKVLGLSEAETPLYILPFGKPER